MAQTIKTDNRSIAGDPKLFIENLGYGIEPDSASQGLWLWKTEDDSSCLVFRSAEEALNGAWIDAVAQTLSISEITCEDWGQMNFDAQRVAMTLALTDELPALSDLSPDTQMEWIEKVREVYPDIGSKEAFQLADKEYLENEGVLSKTAVA